MQAHANDLRAEVAGDWKTLVEVSEEAPADDRLDAFVHKIADDWRGAGLRPAVRRLLEYVETVTRRPWDATESEVSGLRDSGWSDRAIHDAVQVAAYFSYINRVADALGVEVEPGRPHWGR